MRLTPKQLKFIDEFLMTGSGVAAYRASYKSMGMNDRSIRREVTTLLKHPAVRAEIERRQAALAERSLVTVESLTQALLETAQEARGRGVIAELLTLAKESGATLSLGALPLGAAVAAYRTVAQLHGLLKEKRESAKGQLVIQIGTECPPAPKHGEGRSVLEQPSPGLLASPGWPSGE